MKEIKIFFFSFFISLLVVAIVFAVIVNFCGRGVTDQPWVLELYPLKKHFAQEKKSPKIIIIGGSSSLFGINGEKLREYTGMDNINFSMSIMMPMRFYLVDLEKNVQKGDIVVLPLEITNHYLETEEKNFSRFGVSLLFGCIPAAQKTLSLREFCSLYFQYGFSWINTSLFHKDGPIARYSREDFTKQGLFDGVYKEEYVYNRWMQLQSKDKRGKMEFISGVSRYGDRLINQDGKGTNSPVYNFPSSLSQEFLADYNKIKALVHKKGATLLLVWPNLYFYPEQTGCSDFQRMLASSGITIHGRPEALSFPKEFYHDPTYHMNIHGADLWTWELAKTISKATGHSLKKHNKSWPFVVFADNPSHYFPGVKAVREYNTGVRINRKSFPMLLDIPENLRGKDLELSLIAKPDQKKDPVFTRISVSDTSCPVKEFLFPERMELLIHIPARFTKQEQITLSCILNGDEIGMERIFFRNSSKFHFVFKQNFAQPENAGCWTNGSPADFAVRIPWKYRGKNLKLNFDIYTFIHKRNPVCKFKLLTNGRLLKNISSNQFNYTFSLDIPAALTEDLEIPFTIEIEALYSPKELGISEDTRKLGVCLRYITGKVIK